MQTASYTLDTSVLYEQWNLSSDEYLRLLDRELNGKRYTLYYCLYEFKTGLIRSWVEYFQAVEQLRDIPRAVLRASESRGRGSNKVGILLANIHRLSESAIPRNDIEEYLCEVEVLIREANIGFNYVCGQVIGEFSSHPVLKASESLTREDYPEFISICNQHEYIDISDFLSSKEKDLNNLVKHLKARIAILRLKEDWGILQEVVDLIEPLIVKPDRYKNRRKHLGDVVITLNTPKEHTLSSTDKLHEALSSGLGKDYKKVSRIR